MRARLYRHRELLDALREEHLTNQTEVVDAMRKRGFDVTQPSISRDFRELKIVKVGGRYVAAYESEPRANHTTDSKGLIAAVEPIGGHLVIVKTGVGAAGVVAAAIDRLSLEGIAGTVAGDDTIFIATRNKIAQGNIINSIGQLR